MRRIVITAVLLFCSTFVSAATLDDGIALHRDGRLAEAEKAFASIVTRRPGDVEALVWLGRTRLELGKGKDAEEPLESAVSIAPNNAEAHFQLGRVYGQQALEANVLKQAGLAKKTRNHFERAVALDPNHLGAREGLVSYYLQAPAIMGGDLDKAKQQAAAIGRIDRMAGFRQSARIHAHQEDWAGAEAVWNDAVRAFPDRTEPLNGLGFFHQGRKEWSGAFSAFDAAQKLDPDDQTSLYQIGRTAMLSGQQLDRGLAALNRYVTMTPGPNQPPLKWAWLRIGEIQIQRKDMAAARTAIQKSLEIDPQFKEAKEALKRAR